MSKIDRRTFLGSTALGLGGLGLGGLRGLGLGRLGGIGGTGGLGLGIASPPAFGQNADFSGRIIELIIPFKEGGGSDTWGRFNAPFLSRYLPGQPTVVVRNVPGGNSIAGANRFAARARPDGLSVLGTSASTQFPYLMDDPRVRYEYRDWRVLMAYGTGGVAYVSADLGISRMRRNSGGSPIRNCSTAARGPRRWTWSRCSASSSWASTSGPSSG